MPSPKPMTIEQQGGSSARRARCSSDRPLLNSSCSALHFNRRILKGCRNDITQDSSRLDCQGHCNGNAHQVGLANTRHRSGLLENLSLLISLPCRQCNNPMTEEHTVYC